MMVMAMEIHLRNLISRVRWVYKTKTKLEITFLHLKGIFLQGKRRRKVEIFHITLINISIINCLSKSKYMRTHLREATRPIRHLKETQLREEIRKITGIIRPSNCKFTMKDLIIVEFPRLHKLMELLTARNKVFVDILVLTIWHFSREGQLRRNKVE